MNLSKCISPAMVMLTLIVVARNSAAADQNADQKSDSPAVETKAEQIPNTDASQSGDWLDDYLAREMGYSPEQIDAFKATAADMPADKMKAMLQQIKRLRPAGDQTQQESDLRRELRQQTLVSYQRTAQQMRQAQASPTPHPPAIFDSSYGFHPRRTYEYHGNFRGYTVIFWLR
jgi:hypothetical protein